MKKHEKPVWEVVGRILLLGVLFLGVLALASCDQKGARSPGKGAVATSRKGLPSARARVGEGRKGPSKPASRPAPNPKKEKGLPDPGKKPGGAEKPKKPAKPAIPSEKGLFQVWVEQEKRFRKCVGPILGKVFRKALQPGKQNLSSGDPKEKASLPPLQKRR